jgi:hypothetical protein
MDEGTDRGSDPGEDGVWLTYRELAASRQIDRHSAVKLVLKHGWRRQKDNHGVLRALVPKEWMTPRAKGVAVGMAVSMDEGIPQGMDQGTDFAHAISAFGTALVTLREQLERAEQRAATAEQGRELERIRADAQATELRDRIDALQTQLAEAQRAVQGADELRAADDARKAMSRWQRTWSAWRGR